MVLVHSKYHFVNEYQFVELQLGFINYGSTAKEDKF